MNANEEDLKLLRRMSVLALVLLAITLCIVIADLKRYNVHASLYAEVFGVGAIVLVAAAVVAMIGYCQYKIGQLHDEDDEARQVVCVDAEVSTYGYIAANI